MTRQLLTAPQVARMLARSTTWFWKNHKALEAEHGFPASVAGLGARWDSLAIERWLDAQMPAAPVEADPTKILIGRALALTH